MGMPPSFNFLLRLVQWRAVAPSPRVLPPAQTEVVRRSGGRATVHIGVELRWAVVRYRLLIGLFEFKSDCLNMNSAI
jgi:hypothetical protein